MAKGINLSYQDGLWVAAIKVGGKWSKYSRKWRTKEEALKGAKELHKSLNAQYLLDHPEADKPPRKTCSKPAAAGESFEELFLKATEYHVDRQHLRQRTPHRRGAHYIIQGLKEDAALGLRAQKPSQWEKCRKYLLNLVKTGDLSPKTLETYLKDGREVLNRYLVPKGLPDACVAELERLPLASLGSAEASGLPFSKAHLEIMLDLEPTQSDTTRILMWLGASGGLQVGDAALFELGFVLDWDTGHILGRRVKTGETYEFVALPPLLTLLRKRRDKLGNKAIFALPELVFTQDELSDPACNTVRWKAIPEHIVKRASIAGTGIVNEFLNVCGIKSKGITQKSWRKLIISVCCTIGLRSRVSMRIAGQRTLEEHQRYDTPAEFIFTRTADVVWRMFCAIKDREPFFIPTTVFDVYDELHHDIFKHSVLLQALVTQESQNLRAALGDARAENKAMHHKVDQMQVIIKGMEQQMNRIVDMFRPRPSDDQNLVLAGNPVPQANSNHAIIT